MKKLAAAVILTAILAVPAFAADVTVSAFGVYESKYRGFEAKIVTPSFEQQVVLPDKAHNCLSQVTVQAIPATYVDNAAGGQTLTIGG